MKIVSLFPAGSEIICNLGLSDNLIAVSHECDFPLLLNKKIRVTKSIITNSMDQRMIDQLGKNAIQNNVLIYEVDNKKLLEINPDIIIIGKKNIFFRFLMNGAPTDGKRRLQRRSGKEKRI